MVTTEMASMALIKPCPITVMMAMASSSEGKASRTSMIRMIRLSMRPPKKPAKSPSRVPAATANATDPTPAMREIREP
jgi:hypothetical protein